MKKLTLLLLVLFTIAGCARYGKLIPDKDANTCTNKGFSTTTLVRYGDSRMFVTHWSEIGRGYEWRFKLVPQESEDDPANYRVSEVIIDGGDSAPWLTLNDKNKEGDTLTVCVPTRLDSELVFKFDVKVPDIGYLDPRAKVMR